MIDLALCDDFDIGPVRVCPSSREILGRNRTVVVEPKVMQMLVALSRNPGRVVSRDKLIEQCWDGRVVGEDAINRVIGKLRRAATDACDKAFRVETVARVGLRLVPGDTEPTSPTPSSHLLAQGGIRSAWRPWAVAAGLGVGVAAGGFMARRALPHLPALPALTASPALPTAPSLPPAVSDLETRGLSAMFDNTPERTAEGTAYLRQAAMAAPNSAPVWGSLAMSYVLTLGWTSPTETAAVVARVRDAAAHAHTINPRESRSAAALVSLVPTFRNWDDKARVLRAWVRRASPDNGPLRYQRIQFLIAVGRTDEALAQVAPLARSSPLIPWIQATHIDLLAAQGRLAEADHAAADAIAIWPRDPLIWFASFDLAAFSGRPERALAMVDNSANWPRQTSPEDIRLAARTVRAMISRDPAATAAVLLDYRSRSGLGQSHTERAMRAAAALGRPEDAMDFARQLYERKLRAEPRGTLLPLIGLDDDAERPTAALFLPPVQRLWSQSGFMPLMSSIGLIDYWRRTGPPTLCVSPTASPLCRSVEIARYR